MNNVLKQSTSSFIRGTKELQTYRTVNGKKVKHILFKGTPADLTFWPEQEFGVWKLI